VTLLSLASKQIWPQVLAVLNLRPARLVLFHSNEKGESKGPAERLRDFFQVGAVSDAPQVELRRVPHDRFKDVVDGFADAADELGLDDSNCRVHFTGGNKLMALAATEWCRLAGVPCFYLERDLSLFPFLPRGNDLLPQESFQLDPHLAREIEPLALVRCQLGNAEVVGPGQRLTLNESGRNLPDREIQPLLKQGFDFRKFLAWDASEPDHQHGFDLEYAAAFSLLKLGVPVVQRSVRLAPRVLRGSGRQEGELDLVFNWAGKLWVVDCKDRRSAEDKVDQLRTEILRQATPDQRLAGLLDKMTDELRERDLHPLKEDLLAVVEVGGLLGRAVCVRRSPLPVQAAEFANSRNVAVVLKDRLMNDLRSILFPNEPASLDQLRSLAAARTRATAQASPNRES
jgi:hypothetical protein